MKTTLMTDPTAPFQQSGSTIYYPESDGEPVGETDFHISAIFYLRSALRFFLRTSLDTYVAANMLFYYVEGNPNMYKVNV